jgi:rhodanese-related sulfurtransferase
MQHSNGFVALCDAAKKNITEVTREDMQAKTDNGVDFVLVDVREESEWAKSHLPNAIHLSKGVIEVKVEKQIPNHDTDIILYCGGGSRSALAAENLQKMGYTKVSSLIGGFRGWRDNGGELITD